MKDSLREVLQEGIGEQIKNVSAEIEEYGQEVNQTLKNIDLKIREPIQKHGIRLKKIIGRIATELHYTHVTKYVPTWISNNKLICYTHFNYCLFSLVLHWLITPNYGMYFYYF
ncbi:hypothetical protein ACUIJ5_31995 (plasmid) [Bacillus toyonensis]